jgi:zinc transport system substrate-binding protein
MRRGCFLAATLVAAVVALVSTACHSQTPALSQPVLQVTVSILPQKYFVERIGAPYVHANVMIGPGDEPHSYEPKPAQMRALGDSRAYFAIGVEFEGAWLDRFASTNNEMRIVNTVAGMERLPLPSYQNRGADEEQKETELDPHVWTSPRRVKAILQVTYEALVELDPQHAAQYRSNLEAFLADIDELEAYIDQTLAGLSGRRFLVFHPSWGYFAQDYGLEQIAVQVGGQEPSARELAQVIQLARAEDIRVVLAQPEFSAKAAETIAQEIGGRVLLISPLAPDWLDNMRRVAQAFAGTLG